MIVVEIVCACAVQAQTVSEAIAFEERVYKFGTIKEKDGKVSHTFVFLNRGTKPVTISDIYSGCGCIGKIISKENIPPGKKGKVTITFNPEYKSGFFSKEIVVFSNNNNEFNRIWVEGNIVPAEHPIAEEYPYDFGSGLHLRLKVMAFGYMKPGETKQMVLHYANATDKAMELRFVVDENSTGLQFVNPVKIAARAKGVINFTYIMPSAGNSDIIIRMFPYINKTRLTQTLELKVLSEKKRTG